MNEMRSALSLPTWFLVVVLAWSVAAVVHADVPGNNLASALLAKHEALRDRLGNNSFHRPVYLESIENADILEGDVYGVVDHPFATVASMLKEAANWCDVLILNLNVKYCRASEGKPPYSL